MPTMPKTYRPPGSLTEKERNRRAYLNRDKNRSALYDWKWTRCRSLFLKEFPLCRYCERRGRLTPATVVDHVRPHRGDVDLFWNPDNWQPLCAPCHDSIKQREERSAVRPGGVAKSKRVCR